MTDCLLTEEVSDFDSIAVVLDDNVDREMGVYGMDFVLEALSMNNCDKTIAKYRRLHV